MNDFLPFIKQSVIDFFSTIHLDREAWLFIAIYCGMMIAVGLGSWILFKFQVCQVHKVIKRILKNEDFINIKDELTRGETLIGKLDVVFQEEKRWNTYWLFYKQQLLLNKLETNNDKNGWFSSKHSSNFFNEFTLIGSTVNLPFFRATPSILTGLGILGTFIGLTLSLIQITGEIDQKDLTRLLSGAGFAFVTSIVGLVFSLVLTWSNKSNLHYLQNFCRQLSDFFDRAFPVFSKEQQIMLQSSLMEQIEAGLTGRNKEIAREIEQQIEVFTTRLGDRLAIEIENMGKAFGSAVSESAKHLEKASADLNECTQVMRTQTIENVKLMQDCLENASKKIVETNTKILEKTSQTLADSAEKIATKLESKAQVFIDGIQTAFEETQKSNAQVVSTTLDKVLIASTAIETSSAHISTELDRFGNNFKRTVDQIAIENSQMINSLQNLNTSYQATTQVIAQEIKSVVNEVKDSVLAFGEEKKRMLTSLQSLNDSYQQTTKLLATDNQNLIQQATQSMVLSLEQITNKMSGVIAEIKSIVEDQKAIQQTESLLQTNLNQTMQLVNKQCCGFDGLHDLLVAYKSSVDSLTKIEESLNQVAEKAETMTDGYLSVNRQMQESTAHLRTQMNATVREIDLQLANIVKLLNTTVQSWNTTQTANAKEMIRIIQNPSSNLS